MNASGKQLMLEDDATNPILRQMTQPGSSFMKALAMFKQRVTYANVSNDIQVPFSTSAILPYNPYKRHKRCMVSSRRYYRVLEDDIEHPLESYFTFNGSQSSKNGNNNKRKSVRLSSSSASTPTRRTSGFQQQLRDTIASQSSDSSSSNSSSPSDVAPSPIEISSFPTSLHTENANRQPPMEILTETVNERRVSSDEEGEGDSKNNNSNDIVADDQRRMEAGGGPVRQLPFAREHRFEEDAPEPIGGAAGERRHCAPGRSLPRRRL
ncbi:hypothetical protein HMI54_011883 [Coelomomyces lativittatus]|nr:hypothetical protein HMI54_011883 [Coelomomyces lativittatus]